MILSLLNACEYPFILANNNQDPKEKHWKVVSSETLRIGRQMVTQQNRYFLVFLLDITISIPTFSSRAFNVYSIKQTYHGWYSRYRHWLF